MNFKRLSITALQVMGLGFLPSAALAENITDTTTFTGTVPGSCTYSGSQDQTVAMDYSSSGGGTFTGRSANLTVNCNYVATFTLGAVTAGGSNPAETSNTASIYAAIALAPLSRVEQVLQHRPVLAIRLINPLMFRLAFQPQAHQR